MLKSLANSWKTLVFKGVILVILALIAFAKPTATAASIVIWIAALIALDGLVTTVSAIREWKEKEHKWRFLIEGILGIGLGLVLFVTPEITLKFIGYFIAFWFILIGVNRIMMGIRLRKEIEGEAWLILNGLLAVALGAIIAGRPYLGVSSLMWILGFAFLLAGIALIFIGLKFRKGSKKISGKIEDLKDNIRSGMSED